MWGKENFHKLRVYFGVKYSQTRGSCMMKHVVFLVFMYRPKPGLISVHNFYLCAWIRPE